MWQTFPGERYQVHLSICSHWKGNRQQTKVRMPIKSNLVNQCTVGPLLTGIWVRCCTPVQKGLRDSCITRAYPEWNSCQECLAHCTPAGITGGWRVSFPGDSVGFSLVRVALLAEVSSKEVAWLLLPGCRSFLSERGSLHPLLLVYSSTGDLLRFRDLLELCLGLIYYLNPLPLMREWFSLLETAM